MGENRGVAGKSSFRRLRNMIARIRELMHQMPFVSFAIHTSDGKTIQLPTNDHIALSGNFSVIVTRDNGQFDILPALHISGVTVNSLPVAG
jgi:hypothetical protein